MTLEETMIIRVIVIEKELLISPFVSDKEIPLVIELARMCRRAVRAPTKLTHLERQLLQAVRT